MPVMIKSSHGLGDVVQLTVVLRHLRAYRRDWEIDVRCGRGKHSAVIGLCNSVYHDQEECPADNRYNKVYDLGWFENYNGYHDRPNTKVTNCLREVFALEWDAALGRYQIKIRDQAAARARGWLASTGAAEKDGKYGTVVFHYQGNTSPNRKNLSNWQVERLIETTIACGRIPVVLDWDSRSPLIDNKRVFSPGVGRDDIWGGFGSGDAETMAALIQNSEAYIGIDSGPGKVASATDTPTLIIWTGHHPLQFHDPAENTMHLMPEGHLTMEPWRNMNGFFEKHYRYTTYIDESDLVGRAGEWLTGVLKEKPMAVPIPLTYLLPSGIGDAMWALLKLRQVANGDPINIALSGDVKSEIDQRSIPFLRRFPFIRSVRVEDMPILVDREHPNDDEGRYRYREDGRHGDWHFLAPNTPLEHGKRIEEWLPEVPIDYDVINEFSWDGTDRGTREAEQMDPFCAFYLGPESGHCDEGHNWGWLWEPRHWVQLGGAMKRRGLKVCVVGAKYDRSFWERYVRPGVEEDNQSWEDRCGEFEIGETFAFLKRAKFLISYQCGLGIVLHYLGGRVAMWWRPDGNSGNPHRKVCFNEAMKDAWVRPGWEQNYLGLIYKRETPADIVAEIDRRGWAE